MPRVSELLDAVNVDRVSRRALELVEIPSPTGSTRAVTEHFSSECDDLGLDLHVIEDIPGIPAGCDVPSIAAYVRGDGSKTLQIDGHLDTIDMAHPEPRIQGGVLTGRGAVDMKSGLAAALEVVEVLGEHGVTLPGTLLLTAHGMHEAPIGHGEGLRALVKVGHRGDAAIVAEGPCDYLASVCRGMSIWNVTIDSSVATSHENESPRDAPHPIVAAGMLASALEVERKRLAQVERPHVGPETVFTGQLHAGDFYNRFPARATLQGTRRYFADHPFDDVAAEFREIAQAVAEATGTNIVVEFDRVRGGYELSDDDDIVRAFRRTYEALEGAKLEVRAFPSVGDVSILAGEYGIPSVYVGSRGTGAHSDLEELRIDDLVRQTRHIMALVLEYFGVE